VPRNLTLFSLRELGAAPNFWYLLPSSVAVVNKPIIQGSNAMRSVLLTALCATFVLCASLVSAQIMPPSKPVPELGYRVSPDFFDLPANWVEGEASGVALNSKGHIFLFQRTRPMLSEFDENGRYIRSLGEGLFDHPHGLRIDADDNIWTTDDTNNTVLKLSSAGKVLLVLDNKQSAQR
jgi:hypothetical protein